MNHKKNARAIFQEALCFVNPLNLKYDLKEIPQKKIMLLGSGKASAYMAKALMRKIGDRVYDAFVVSNFKEHIEGVEVFESSHPIPSKKSVKAAEIMIEKLRSLKEDDFFIYLLSGGSSALVEKPIFPITIEELVFVNNLLLGCGADIREINIVRKHLSSIKGGRLAENIKAKGVVYVISDVVGDDLESIGSAPLYFDGSYYDDALNILKKYDLWKRLPKSVCDVIEKKSLESPKEPNINISHKIVASNSLALKGAYRKALKLGYDTKIVTDNLNKSVEESACYIVEKIKNEKSQKPVCLLFGGESTVTLIGSGKGGRNQELALRVLKKIKDDASVTFLSGATDGIDANCDAAGAVVNAGNFKGDIDKFLSNNDSYHYHKREKTLIVTGESGTNVMDIMIAIKE